MGRRNRGVESSEEETMSRLRRLKYVQSLNSAGGTYHYFRRRGSPRIPLPGLVGSAEFMAAYADALAASPVAIGKDLRSKPGSVSIAIAEYYGSRAFRSLTGGTPQKRRALLERFREQYGHKPLASLPKEFLAALLDPMPPHAARNWLKAVRHFIRYAEDRKLIDRDPTLGIRLKVPKSDGHHSWTDDEIAAFGAITRSARRRGSRWRSGSTPRSGVATSSASVASTFAMTCSRCASKKPGRRWPSPCIPNSRRSSTPHPSVISHC
jgi:hypothetical protein